MFTSFVSKQSLTNISNFHIIKANTRSFRSSDMEVFIMDWDDNPKFIYEREPSRDILCIDCKSFYASVECVERGLNPLKTKLVVMSYPSDDPAERGSGLILASSPAAKKAFQISNVSRARDLPFPYPPDLSKKWRIKLVLVFGALVQKLNALVYL